MIKLTPPHHIFPDVAIILTLCIRFDYLRIDHIQNACICFVCIRFACIRFDYLRFDHIQKEQPHLIFVSILIIS